MSLIGFFDRGMSLGPDRVAYVQGDESWTFRRAYDVTCRVSNALLAEGLAAETRCAVLAGNSPLAWLCVLGVWRAGLAWVPLNLGTGIDRLPVPEPPFPQWRDRRRKAAVLMRTALGSQHDGDP
jgi:acyl-CoA synthetase (AMP-forming)/AMP-acid ligase II